MVRRTAVLSMLLAPVWACGDGSPGRADASTAADAGDGDDGSAQDAGLVPLAPAPPRFLPCPPGWREVAPTDGVSPPTCDPWPEGGPASCADDEAHFPGEQVCTRVGSSCPAGDFADDLPADGTVLFVSPTATAVGRGTRESPYRSITDALRRAGPGTIIALGKGTLDGVVAIPAGVTLWGACVAGTVLTYASSAPPPRDAILVGAGDGAAVRNLRVVGGSVAMVGVGAPVAGATLRVDDVLVERTIGAALVADRGGRLEARGVVARGILADRRLGGDSAAMLCQSGSELVLSRTMIVDSEGTGVRAVTGRVTASDFAVVNGRDPGGSLEPNPGLVAGVYAGAGSSFELRRVVLDAPAHLGLFVRPGATVDAQDLVVRRPVPVAADGPNFGFGVFAQGGSVTLRRALFDATSAEAIVAQLDATLHGEDVVVRDTASTGVPPHTGRALNAQLGAHVSLERAVLARSHEVAVLASQMGTTVELTDLLVADTLPREDDRAGQGIQLQQGASVTLARVEIRGSLEVGVAVIHAGSSLHASDLRVAGTLRSRCTGCAARVDGVGVGVYGAYAELRSFVVELSDLVGFQLADGAGADLFDGLIQDNPIGANVVGEAFDTRRLQNRVLFVRNERNLAADLLPVPAPFEELPTE